MSSVGVTDNRIQQLQQEIERKRGLLQTLNRDIPERSNLNKFLKIVNTDYEKYLDEINRENREKLDALQNIATYLESINNINNSVTQGMNALPSQAEVNRDLANVRAEITRLRDLMSTPLSGSNP